MARLPNPGGDDGTWGNVLNEFLQVAHQDDGTLNSIDFSALLAVLQTTGGGTTTILELMKLTALINASKLAVADLATANLLTTINNKLATTGGLPVNTDPVAGFQKTWIQIPVVVSGNSYTSSDVVENQYTKTTWMATVVGTTACVATIEVEYSHDDTTWYSAGTSGTITLSGGVTTKTGAFITEIPSPYMRFKVTVSVANMTSLNMWSFSV